MTENVTVITDTDREIQIEELTLGAAGSLSLAGADNWSIRKRTLRGGVSEGVEVIDLDNGRFALSVLPTRGMGIWRGKFRLENGESIPVEWKSPVARPVHPAHVHLAEVNGLGWLGGFNELLCRCGLSFNGPPGMDEQTGQPLTLHGRIANRPAHRVEVAVSDAGAGRLRVTGTAGETMLFGPALRLTSTLETEAGSIKYRIRDEVTNMGGQTAEVELLYHVNFGRPFLEAQSRFMAPIREMAPRDPRAAEGIETWDIYAPPEAGYAEQVYFMELLGDADQKSLVLLQNSAGDRGVSLRIDRRGLPCFTLWKNTQAEADGYVTGLEPGTNFPNIKSFEREQGRVIQLEPGESRRTEFDLAVHATADDVQAVREEIGRLQGETTPVVHSRPRPGWSPE